jgi:hypothetical protein
MAAKTLRRYVLVSDESESELEAVKVTRKYTSHVYKEVQQFSDFDTANKTVKEESKWRYNYSNDTDEGRKVYYNCNTSRTCPVKLLLLFKDDTRTVILYKTSSEHSHELKHIGIPTVCKEHID